MKTITQAYLRGIREGRETLQQFERDGIANLETARAALANCKELLGMGFADEMRDSFRGERDFWKNQIKKGLIK